MWLSKCRKDVSLLGFIDSFKSGRLAKKKIYLFNHFKKGMPRSNYDLILVASGANREIAELLQSEELPYAIIHVPSYLMENLLPVSLSERINRIKITFISWFFRPELHLFFGEHGGKFIGNNKYYYLYLKNNHDLPAYWVVDQQENPGILEELKQAGIRVVDFNSLDFYRLLYQASYFYFDNMTWQRKYPWLRFYKARIIHMSHGVGLKTTEKMLIPDAFLAELNAKEKKRLDSKIFKNHLLVSTSDFYARNVSSPAYDTPLDRVVLSGYPKNDLFYREIKGSDIYVDSDSLETIDTFKKDGGQVIVYAPTFRDMDARFQCGAIIDFAELDTFLKANKLLFVIKGHTSVNGSAVSSGVGSESSGGYDNILLYANQRDGYPLLNKADILITDYSSIYMDFLHSNKPIIFFVYDYQEYIANHRELQFDYEEMTPGPKVKTDVELRQWITHFLVKNEDGFQGNRKKIKNLSFKHKDGSSSARIYDKIVDTHVVDHKP